MIDLLVDTSVLIKWFHAAGESEVGEARALRDAHVRGQLDLHVIDLAVYEVGNVLVRALRWGSAAAADQLEDLLALVGTPLEPPASWHRAAAGLAEQHGLTFYDASWAAAAEVLRVPLVSADLKLQSAGLAESPAAVSGRLHLT